MRKMRRFRSSCACAKNYQGFCSPFIHAVLSNNSIWVQWRPWSDCADAQAVLVFCYLICPQTRFRMARPKYWYGKKYFFFTELCRYNGVAFKQGQRWDDGCDLQCVCEDETTGYYRCNQRLVLVPTFHKYMDSSGQMDNISLFILVWRPTEV